MIKKSTSLLGFGCMRLPQTAEGKIDYDHAQKMVDYAYENGVNYFDTAWNYHNEESELFIGQALKKYPRDSFILATKTLWMKTAIFYNSKNFLSLLKKKKHPTQHIAGYLE